MMSSLNCFVKNAKVCQKISEESEHFPAEDTFLGIYLVHFLHGKIVSGSQSPSASNHTGSSNLLLTNSLGWIHSIHFLFTKLCL